MSAHLSARVISHIVIEEGTPEQLRHLEVCPACRLELERLRNALTQFRVSADEWLFRGMAPAPPPRSLPKHVNTPWRVLAVLSIILLAVTGTRYATQARIPMIAPATTYLTDAALLDRVRAEVSRAIPGELQPLAVPIDLTSPGSLR